MAKCHITVKQIEDTVQLCKAGGYIPNAVQHTIGQMLKGDIDDIGPVLNKAAVMCPYDGTAQLPQEMCAVYAGLASAIQVITFLCRQMV